MKNARWVWLAAAALVVGFWGWRALAAPLPFYAFQSDPELRYYYNSLLLAHGQRVEHTDHPGTALQCTGAVIARGLGLKLADAFDPAALQRFLLVWRIVALTSLLGTGAWLARRLQGRGAPFDAPRASSQSSGWAVALLGLLFAFDYQTLVYWLTFTPESAFFVLYLPVALFCALRASQPGAVSWRTGLLLAALLGFITTIKLTLWPVTLFVLGLLAFAASPPASARGWRRFAGFTVIALLTYAVTASVLAEHPGASWRWVLALLQHNGRYGGRYGAVASEAGLFPPWSVGFEALQRAFALQAYTTLPVLGGALLWALWPWRQQGEPSEGGAACPQDAGLKSRVDQRVRDNALHLRSARTAGLGFVAALVLLFVMFLKHPYQGKYLLPASLLIVLFAAVQVEAGRLPPLRWLRPLCLILGLIVFNAVLSQKLLYDYTIPRAERIGARIDAWLARTPHDAVIFSSRLPHPIPAYRESAPPQLLPIFTQRFGRMEPTGTFSLDFQRVAAARSARRARAHRLSQHPHRRSALAAGRGRAG